MSVQFQFRRDTRATIATKTPAVAELGYQTDVKQFLFGDGTTLGGIELARKNYVEPLAPAQFTADQNDYAPSGFKYAGLLRISANAARNLTGIAGGTDGRRLFLLNTGTFAITLKDANAGSVAANRFSFGADVTLGAGQAVQLFYSSTDNAWRLASSASAADGGSAAVVKTDLIQNRAGTRPPAVTAGDFCKAWAKLNGSTAAILTSLGISSTVDAGIGLATVNLTIAMTSTHYSAHVSDDYQGISGVATFTASSYQVFNDNASATPTDPITYHTALFGTQS